MFKKWLKRAIHLILGIVLSLVIPITIKQFILRPIRFTLIGDNWGGQLFQWGSSLVLMLTGYMVFVRFFEKRSVKELSIHRFLPDILKGWLWGMISIGGIISILAAAGVYSVSGINKEIGTYQLILMLILLSTFEEIFYRGLIYRLIEKWKGTGVALLISSFLFSIMHLGNNHYNFLSFIAIITGGMVMGLIYTGTGSLWWPIAAHFSWNYTQVALGLTLSGINEFNSLSIINGRLAGPELLTGGNFGVENSLVTILYTIIMTVVLWVVISRKKIRI